MQIFEVLSTGKPWQRLSKRRFSRRRQTALEKGFAKESRLHFVKAVDPVVTQMHDTFKVPCVLIGFGLPDLRTRTRPTNTIYLENLFQRDSKRSRTSTQIWRPFSFAPNETRNSPLPWFAANLKCMPLL